MQTLGETWKKSTEEFIKASEWRGKPYMFIDQILEAVATKLVSPEGLGDWTFQPLPELDTLRLEVFAGGTLAKLQNKHRHPLFNFTSNLRDGPRGRSGEFRLAFDFVVSKE